jgi:hypothetical protein
MVTTIPCLTRSAIVIVTRGATILASSQGIEPCIVGLESTYCPAAEDILSYKYGAVVLLKPPRRVNDSDSQGIEPGSGCVCSACYRMQVAHGCRSCPNKHPHGVIATARLRVLAIPLLSLVCRVVLHTLHEPTYQKVDTPTRRGTLLIYQISRSLSTAWRIDW